MIIVVGVFDVDPADRARFIEGRRAQVEETRAEAGCIEYAFSLDAYDPGRVRLFRMLGRP